MSVFKYSHRVSYADCTIGNHIYYGRYLELLEKARGEFFRHLSFTFQEWQQKDAIFPVTDCALHYRFPARYDDLLQIELSIANVRGARLVFSYRLLNEAGRVVLEGETAHACTTVEGKPRRVPEGLIAMLKDYTN